MDETVSLQYVPPEVLEKIFSFLDTQSLRSCWQVCKKWRAVCATINPLLVPQILGRIFSMFDRDTLLQIRLVCKLWKGGLDKLTEHNGLLIRGQSVISPDRTSSILQSPDTANPFPSRTVRISFILNERRSMMDISLDTAAVIQLFGHHIKNLNIKIITCSTKCRALKNVVRNVALMLPSLQNLEGLSIYISFAYGNDSFAKRAMDESNNNECTADELGKEFKIPLLSKLKAFRLVAWNFASEETEWLYYEILKNAPNLEYFDPDYFKGYSKFCTIFSQPQVWPFQLKCLKLAVSGRVCTEVFKLISEARYPLDTVHLDIFEYKWETYPKSCTWVLETVIRNCGSTLKTLALSFYVTSKFIPASWVGQSTLLRRVVSNYNNKCMFYSNLKLAKFLPSYKSEFALCNLQNLKLRGFQGSLNFLKDFKHLKRLMLLDYNSSEQSVFNCENSFYRYIPSLKDLYTPNFGSFPVNSVAGKLIDKQYLSIY